MMTSPRPSRTGQAGLMRGCCFGLVLLVVLLGGAALLGQRVLAAPDLGPSPGGAAHGGSQVVIAAALAGAVATQLVAQEHAVVVLSERDLTVLVQARNPSPDRFRDPQARVRGGHVVVSADTSVGPFGVTAVAGFVLNLVTTAETTEITARPVDYAAGQLAIPTVLGDRLEPKSSATLNLTTLFAANPALALLSRSLECLAVLPDGVHLGFHRPGIPASGGVCG